MLNVVQVKVFAYLCINSIFLQKELQLITLTKFLVLSAYV